MEEDYKVGYKIIISIEGEYKKSFLFRKIVEVFLFISKGVNRRSVGSK